MEGESYSFTLNYDNIKEIPFEKYLKDFTFIVNGKKYETSRFLADTISPIIRKFHYNDQSVDSFTINTKILNQNQNDYFEDFLALSSFKRITISGFQRKLYSEYFLQLGNINEYFLLDPRFNENLNPNNVIVTLKALDAIIKDGPNLKEEYFEKIIKFAAQYFEEIPKEELKELSLNMIESIIKSQSFQLSEEDSLLNFILELYEKDVKYSILFEYVIFQNVDEATIEKFIEQFNLEDINLNIWKSICTKLLPSRKLQIQAERYKAKIIEIDHKKGNEFNGIMKFLSDKTGGNIHDNGTIEITSNSIFDDDNDYHPKHLVNYGSNDYYKSKGDKLSNICFDFKDIKIQLNGYSIKSGSNGSNSYHLRNWVIEVSNDAKKWEIVDSHSNESSLNGAEKFVTYKTEEKNNNYYRYIQIRQADVSWDDSFKSYFRFIEFYGKMKCKNEKIVE